MRPVGWRLPDCSSKHRTVVVRKCNVDVPEAGVSEAPPEESRDFRSAVPGIARNHLPNNRIVGKCSPENFGYLVQSGCRE